VDKKIRDVLLGMIRCSQRLDASTGAIEPGCFFLSMVMAMVVYYVGNCGKDGGRFRFVRRLSSLCADISCGGALQVARKRFEFQPPPATNQSIPNQLLLVMSAMSASINLS
jgi:hypothetical protein